MPVSADRAISGRFASRKPVGHTNTFRRDQRGAVAFEMPFVFSVLMFSLLLPLADLAMAGFQFISAHQALRDFGQYAQYHAPSDITTWSSWVSSLPSTATTISGYHISNIKVICGDTGTNCSSGNTASPKYYSYTTTFALSPLPLVLQSVLCGSGNSTCSFTLASSERFQ